MVTYYQDYHGHTQMKFELIHWGLLTLVGDMNLVNIGSGNGLLPDSTKQLPEPMLTYYQ